MQDPRCFMDDIPDEISTDCMKPNAVCRKIVQIIETDGGIDSIVVMINK